MTEQKSPDVSMFVQKGSRVRAEWFESDNFTASLTGAQLKTTGRFRSITGTVRHLRTNDPTWNPQNVTAFIETTDNTGELCQRCGVNEIRVPMRCVVEVLRL